MCPCKALIHELLALPTRHIPDHLPACDLLAWLLLLPALNAVQMSVSRAPSAFFSVRLDILIDVVGHSAVWVLRGRQKEVDLLVKELVEHSCLATLVREIVGLREHSFVAQINQED